MRLEYIDSPRLIGKQYLPLGSWGPFHEDLGTRAGMNRELRTDMISRLRSGDRVRTTSLRIFSDRSQELHRLVREITGSHRATIEFVDENTTPLCAVLRTFTRASRPAVPAAKPPHGTMQSSPLGSRNLAVVGSACLPHSIQECNRAANLSLTYRSRPSRVRLGGAALTFSCNAMNLVCSVFTPWRTRSGTPSRSSL